MATKKLQVLGDFGFTNLIVDKCCQAVTESGATVMIDPVEDSSLQVISYIEPIQEGSVTHLLIMCVLF